MDIDGYEWIWMDMVAGRPKIQEIQRRQNILTKPATRASNVNEMGLSKGGVLPGGILEGKL